MHLRILGCHGGESPSHRTSCFAIDDKLLLDAGSATRSLSLDEQTRIDYVVLSHSHLDHVKGLPLLLDNIFGKREQPVTILASPGTTEAISKHLFNGLLWPDFGRLPSPEKPTSRMRAIEPREPHVIDGYEIRLIPMHHTVECHGIIVSNKSTTLAYTGDTGPTSEFWQAVSAMPKLQAIICEVSFPNELETLAKVTGHLTPKLLEAELAKHTSEAKVPVLVTHLKPGSEEQVKAEIAELANPRIKVLRLMDEFDF